MNDSKKPSHKAPVPQEPNKCCGKCIRFTKKVEKRNGEVVSVQATMPTSCGNPDCPCHKDVKEEWSQCNPCFDGEHDKCVDKRCECSHQPNEPQSEDSPIHDEPNREEKAMRLCLHDHCENGRCENVDFIHTELRNKEVETLRWVMSLYDASTMEVDVDKVQDRINSLTKKTQ